MLQTIAATLGETFAASRCLLYPLEENQFIPDFFLYEAPGQTFESLTIPNPTQDALLQATLESRQTQIAQSQSSQDGNLSDQLVIPLIYQQDFLAILCLYHREDVSPWSEEEIQLIESVAEQAALAISQAKLYQRTQLQAEQMRSELSVARQIQENLLRQSLPNLDGVRVQACCYPAREVGGDFFEVYAHPQGDVWLAVGDVSGKGVPAALFMASAISVLRRELAQESPPEPDILMKNLNSILSEELISANCFITMVLARYTPSTRQLVYANAGHIYPLVWSNQAMATHSAETIAPSTVEPNYLKVRGVPLGILPNWKAAAGSLELNSGEVLLLTSDGITEATVSNAELANGKATSSQLARSMLQQTGLWQLLLQEQSLDLTHLLARIRAHNIVQEDDQTLLSLEVL
jgi:serine phosphatase RsbU (regulator of sigma subunit)